VNHHQFPGSLLGPGSEVRIVVVKPPPDHGLMAVLDSLGVYPATRLGRGGEATVYALDEDRVVRVLHEGGDADSIRRRQSLVAELSRTTGPGFALPDVLDIGEVEGRWYAIERRLVGRSVLQVLEELDGKPRRRLIEAHLDAAAALGDLRLDHRAYFGDLAVAEPVTAATWRGYLTAKATSSLVRAGPDFSTVAPDLLADALPDVTDAAFVHLDAFAGNMLTDGQRITAVIDIGPSSAAGDRRIDPVAAAVYLCAPQITPMVRSADVRLAATWLRLNGLDGWFDPVQRWLAAYWAFAVEDVALHRWCRAVLLGS
jgi:aminoglycoside phosphotransferase (APT) family kinase protein